MDEEPVILVSDDIVQDISYSLRPPPNYLPEGDRKDAFVRVIFDEPSGPRHKPRRFKAGMKAKRK